MAYLATSLNVPNFLFSRNRIKKDPMNWEHLKKHVAKNQKLLVKKCVPPPKAKSMLYRTDRMPCRTSTGSSLNRDLITSRPWSMPPNLYNVLDEPYASHKGLKGAYWEKLHTKKPPPPPPKVRITARADGDESQPTPKAYNMCNKYKGFFNSNARERKPTSRFMVSDLTTCWRNPNDPGPLNYCGKTTPLGKSFSENMIMEKPNPHIFVPHTCVPEKETILRKKHSHFLPGPGRYDIFFQKICHTCRYKNIYGFITQEIEKQKRFKFRRLPYKKINSKKYCDPQFSHIIGHGHRHLFLKPTEKKKEEIEDESAPKDKTKHKETKDIKMYAEPKYIHLINNPDRKTMTIPDFIQDMPVKIFYNTLAKRVKRRQLQMNKKIAFMSGQTRWKDAERPMPLTVTQMENLKLSLPPERRLHDHSITKTPIEELECRVMEIPPHMQPAFKISLKKHLYKFKKLPDPKILVTENDIRSFYENGQYVGSKFYFQPIIPQDYFKDEEEEADEEEQVSRMTTGD